MAKIQDWLEEDKLILLEGWARDGLSEDQIAKNMGITRPTLWDWKKKELNIFNALKKGKEVVDFEVENALYKNALEGNVTAQIFWLKNRRKEQWREKVEPPSDPNELSKVEELLNKIKEESENDIKQ